MPRTRRPATYQARKAAGLCVGCGGPAPRPGRVSCVGCTARQARYKELCRVHPARLHPVERRILLEDAQALGLDVREQSPDAVQIGDITGCDWPLLAGIVAGLLRQRERHAAHERQEERPHP